MIAPGRNAAAAFGGLRRVQESFSVGADSDSIASRIEGSLIMSHASWLAALAGFMVLATPAAAGPAPLDPELLAETAPGYRYPGPFFAPQKYVIYQRPLGDFVWNGRWYDYHDPYLAGSGHQRVLRRSY